MAEERVIQQADLRHIERGLQAMAAGLDDVRTGVVAVGAEVQSARTDISRLWTEFQAFLDADKKAKQLQLAETRVVKVRQELETRYGHYSEVRRRTLGILQASDIRLVRQETVRSASEQMMLASPGYWLAPALVAMSAWISDDPELAMRAAVEGAKRDDEKTSLFFALVCRRADRLPASGIWLDRFFATLDPNEVDRQTVVLIDAVACGVFGADARNRCTMRFDEWTSTLAEKAGFVEKQRTQWKLALQAQAVSAAESKYPELERRSSTWPALERTMQGARLHAAVYKHFKLMFDGAIQPPSSVAAAVDQLLEKLVTNFDDEELPLRRDERLFQLIIEMEGDRDAAKHKFDLEAKSHDDRVDFTQLLTNAAMHAESSKASRATQRFATALSRHWIAAAHSDLTAENRSSVPTHIDLAVAGWKGKTADGSNEAELMESLSSHLKDEEQRALAGLFINPVAWLALIAGVGTVIYGLASMKIVWGLVGLVGVGVFVAARHANSVNRARVINEAAISLASARDTLKALMAEVVDWRRDYAALDGHAGHVEALLARLAPHEHQQTPHDRHRNIMA